MARGRPPTTPKALRERILARRGDYTSLSPPTIPTNGHSIPDILPPLLRDSTYKKSTMMLLLERLHQLPIEQLIWQQSVKDTAELLEVSAFTVSNWRRRFPLEQYTIGPNNRRIPINRSDA